MTRDPTALELALRTLRIGLEATLLASLLALPLGVALGLGRFRGRAALLGAFNAGLRFPPVVLGHALWLCMWASSPWGGGPLSGLGWLYTFDAVILAQTLLVVPIVVALTASAVQGVPSVLFDQARAFGASGTAVAVLAVREARVGVGAALIAALGTAMASVGAVLVIGDQSNAATLPSAALTAWTTGGRRNDAAAYGAMMLGLFLAVAAALTVLQRGGGRPRWLLVRS